MNSLPGPDKGLFDVLFGSKPAEAQAAPQAVLPGEQAMSVEDFMTALAKAQDQTAAAAPGPQPKGEMPVNAKSSTVLQAQPQPAIAKALVKAEAKPVKPESKDKSKSEVAEQSVKPAVAQTPSAQAQAAAAMAAAQQQQQVTTKAEPAVGGSQLASKKPAVQGRPGPKAPVAHLPKAQHELELAAAQNAVAAQAQAAPKGAAGAKAAAEAQAAPAPAVLQPIVIQVPVPMPFEVVESSEEPVAELGRGSKGHVSSQDFLASRGATLGVDRPDPRLVTRVRDNRSDNSEGQSNQNGQNGSSDFAMLMPHVTSAPKEMAYKDARVSASAGPQHLSSIHSSQLEASNPMALASSVQNLMARGGGSVKVRLAPENLGEMTISVQQGRNRQLDVKFEAGSKEARETLLSSVPQLRDALSASRYDVGSIEVARPAAETASIGSSMSGISVGGTQLGMGSGFGMMSQERSFGDQANQGQNHQGSPWDRYNDQQERSQNNNGHGRGRDQQSAYRRYQEYAYGA